MKGFAEKIEAFMELGGMKKDVIFLVISGAALLLSIFRPVSFPVDPA